MVFQEQPVCEQIRKHLTEKLTDKQAADRLQSILNNVNNNIGFIINERFVNIPPQIAEPSFASLW